MIPKSCKRLAEVDFPIAEVSQHAAREKSMLPDGDSLHAELRVTTASFMGYGLYDQGTHTVDETHRRFSDYIYCP